MKVSIYARESSDDITKAPDIQIQIQRGKDWIVKNNHELVKVYADNGFSGGDWKRPEWNQSVNDAKRHAYQILWVWNQDRLARDTEQFLWFYRNIKSAKVNIYEDSSSSFIDMETLGGRVKHQAIAQAAEIFRLVTSEKVKKAYTNKHSRGEHWGRDPIPKELVDLVIEIKNENPNLSLRKIASMIPPYKLKDNKTERKVSHVWVKRVLQNNKCIQKK